MPKPPVLKAREICKLLEGLRFKLLRQEACTCNIDTRMAAEQRSRITPAVTSPRSFYGRLLKIFT